MKFVDDDDDDDDDDDWTLKSCRQLMKPLSAVLFHYLSHVGTVFCMVILDCGIVK